MTDWISVEDRLPPPGMYLISDSNSVYVAEFDRNWGFCPDVGPWFKSVTHWMPLPEPPK